MGCAQSTPKPEKAPPEPLPDLQAIQSSPARAISGEPALLPDDESSSMTDPDNATTLSMKQVGDVGTGSTFEIAKTDSSNVDDFILSPAFGLGGQIVRRQMQDLLKLCRKEKAKPLCYCVKSPEQGRNVFKVLVDRPMRDTQPASIFKGPNETKLYIFASAEFNLDSRICSVKVYGQGKTSKPLYTIRQCTAKVWVLKKNEVVVCQMQQVEPLVPKFRAYEMTVSPNVDLAFVICLTNICDWFAQVCKQDGVKYYQ